MIRTLFFTITSFISFFSYAAEYNSQSNIINLKHGYQLGDLIVVTDQITSKKPFVETPKLIVKETTGINLLEQEGYQINNDEKYTFFNTITYQIFHQSEGKKYVLPTHLYKIGNDELEIAPNSYWFSRVASSNLNDVILNSLPQVKPMPIYHNALPLYLSLTLLFFSLLILLYKQIDFSFINRMFGPFTKASKKIKSLHRLGNKKNYDESILILLDSCNKTFGQNMHSSSVDKLIPNSSKYFASKQAIKAFVDITNDEIYSSKSNYSKNRFDMILKLSKELKMIERKL